MHVAGSQNTAADFLSRLELTPKGKVQLKLRDDILTSPIEFNLQSSDVADEDYFFFLPDEEESEQTRKRTIKKSDRSYQNTAVYSFGAIKENALIRNEQDADLLLKALKSDEPTKNRTSIS